MASGGEAAYLRSQKVTREGFTEGWGKRWRLFFEKHGMDAEGYLTRLPVRSFYLCGVLAPLTVEISEK
eukprot:2344063-Prymnesium_polylepis.1